MLVGYVWNSFKSSKRSSKYIHRNNLEKCGVGTSSWVFRDDLHENLVVSLTIHPYNTLSKKFNRMNQVMNNLNMFKLVFFAGFTSNRRRISSTPSSNRDVPTVGYGE